MIFNIYPLLIDELRIYITCNFNDALFNHDFKLLTNMSLYTFLASKTFSTITSVVRIFYSVFTTRRSNCKKDKCSIKSREK